jgi:hypothetical protein
MDAVQIAIEEGRVPWPRVNPGYVRGEDGRFYPDPELAPIIETAFWLRTQPGVTVYHVMLYLRASGFPAMTYRRTQSMLASKVYLGEIHFNQRRRPSDERVRQEDFKPNLRAHDPIVTPEVWNAVQRKVESRGRRAQSERLLARQAVLTCGSCGGFMVVSTTRPNQNRPNPKDRNRHRVSYRCSFTTSPDCPRHVSISADPVEELVENATVAALMNVEGRASQEARAREAEDALERAQANLDAAIDALEDFTDASATRKLDKLRAVRDDAQKQVDELPRTRPTKTIRVAEDWNLLSLPDKRALIRATIKRVVVDPGKGVDRVTIETFNDTAVIDGSHVSVLAPVPADAEATAQRVADRAARRQLP